MFSKYQIPSDLLSYEGPEDRELSTKMEQVKRNVAALQDMIQSSKQAELKSAAEERVKTVLTDPTMYALDDSPAIDGFAAQMEIMAPRKEKKGGGGGGGMMKAAKGLFRSRAAQAPTTASVSFGETASIGAMAPMDDCKSDAPEPPAPAEPKPSEPTPDQPDKPKQPLEVKPGGSSEDYTSLPGTLDTKISALDTDHALRSTIIKPGTSWAKHFQKGLLSKPSTMFMGETEQKDDKNAAFDLLDALSRSGVLSIDQASLHVVLMATHCFDKTLVATVIQDNVNPIEKVERSALILASTVHNVLPLDLVHPEQRGRVELYAPSLLGAE